MSTIRVSDDYKVLVGLFKKLTGKKALWQVFNDCIEMIAISIQNAFLHGSKFRENENRYGEIAKQYSKDEQKIISQIYSEIINLLEKNPFSDLLGDLYMQLNMGSDALGQMFTPYNISLLSAEITFDEDTAKSEIENQGYIKVLEPSAGGGANVIAFCEVLKNRGYNYQTQCIVVCQELSRLTAIMCYIVLSLIGCAAVIKVGDSLCNPYTNYMDECKNGSELWVTPLFCINDCIAKV